MNFGNPLGLYAFFALIPFILIYLIKPKPLDKTIPSLMFFLKQQQTNTRTSFLRNFLMNLLFIIQILALIGLCFAVARPEIDIPFTDTSKATVLVIDSSSSMKTVDSGSSRFARAISEAKKNIQGSTSIILVGNVPYIALEDGSASDAENILDSIQPIDSTSDIGNAMLMSRDMLKKGGRVVVISDFISTHGPDVLVAKRSLSSAEIAVEFIDVSKDAKNVGITELNVGRYQSTAMIKNFNEKEENVKITLTQWGSTKLEKTVKIPPLNTEVMQFDTLSGKSELSIASADDNLAADNKAYISSPDNKKITVLLITNNPSSFLRKALESSKVIELKIAEPPVIPKITEDVIIMNQVKKEDLISGTFEEISARVRNGSSFVVTAQDDSAQIDIKQMHLINLIDIMNKTQVHVNIFNEFTTDAEFGTIGRYFKAQAPNTTIIVASADDESPIITFRDYGSGKVVYYGIFDESSEFVNTPSYPIFWENLASFLTESEDINDYNKKLDENPLVTQAGFSQMDGISVAFNLISEKESNINKGEKEERIEEEQKEFVLKEVSSTKKSSIEILFLISAAVLLICELIYIKFRGDL